MEVKLLRCVAAGDDDDEMTYGGFMLDQAYLLKHSDGESSFQQTLIIPSD